MRRTQTLFFYRVAVLLLLIVIASSVRELIDGGKEVRAEIRKGQATRKRFDRILSKIEPIVGIRGTDANMDMP